MPECPSCGYQFDPKKYDVDDFLKLASVSCPSCKKEFSVKLQFVAQEVKDLLP